MFKSLCGGCGIGVPHRVLIEMSVKKFVLKDNALGKPGNQNHKPFEKRRVHGVRQRGEHLEKKGAQPENCLVQTNTL